MAVGPAALLVLLAVVCGAGAAAIRAELRARRRDATLHALLATFAPAVAQAQADPRQLLAWYPLAQAARRLFADRFAELDAATGSRFPFAGELVSASHARWTTEWLTWEAAHDAEFRLKAAAVEEEGMRAPQGDPSILRARIAAIEREKLERYQRRYEEYIRIAKALAALDGPAADTHR